MTEIKRYITESTKPGGEIVREERIVYVSKSGEEFNSAQAAYRDDVEVKLLAILGPAVDPIAPGYGGCFYSGDRDHDAGRRAGFNRAVKRMLNDPEPFIRLLETWNANRNS
jgi:hypothetical protein